jgi:hypothetical protein
MGEEVAELLLEEGEAFPGGEGVAVDVEGGGDGGGGVAGEEEAGGAELVGGEGARGAGLRRRGWKMENRRWRGRWVRFAQKVILARVGVVWQGLARLGVGWRRAVRLRGMGQFGTLWVIRGARLRGGGYVLRRRG